MNGGLRNTSRYLLAGVSALGLLAFGGSAAKAANVEQLEAAMKAMQAQMEQLQREVAAAKAQAAAASAAASSGGGGGDLDLKVKWKGAPELSSGDGKFKFKVRGRFNVDYNGIDQDQRITGEGDISAVELRRARIGVEGVVYYDWVYKLEVDFAGAEVSIKDAYVGYTNWGPESWETSEILFGNFKVPNSLEELTSSRFITFNERAAFTEAFFLDRQIGAGINVGSEHWSFRTGYFGATAGEEGGIPGQENFDTDQTAAAVRATIAPINNDTAVVHLGGSYRHRDAGTLRDCGAALCDGGPNALFQYRARGADLHLADRFVDTPQFADSDEMFVLEGAIVYKSLSVQGEYAQLEANSAKSIADNIDPTYDGWYVDLSWYITGEMRNYEADVGEFGRTKVKNPFYGGSGGWGAWQIAGRYDTIDLSDKAAAIANFGVVNCNECGEQETWLIALNWWMTDYTAIKLQVSQSEIKGGVNDGAEITGVGVRAQVDW